MFTVSINPTHYCNLSCDFCYLSKTQLKDKTLLALDILDTRLTTLATDYRPILCADIYGGEISLLPEDYVNDIINLCQSHGIEDINLITNLANPSHAALQRPDVCVSVSYDGPVRDQADRTLTNIAVLGREVEVLTLASAAMFQRFNSMNHLLDEFCVFLNATANIRSFEIKPYSVSQHNAPGFEDILFEDMVKGFLKRQRHIKPELVNGKKIVASLLRQNNAFSDDHVYILPSGDLAVLDFDERQREYFRVLPSVAAYQQWCDEEKARVRANAYCGACPYLGQCLSEHLREVTTITPTCNGFRGLLDSCSLI